MRKTTPNPTAEALGSHRPRLTLVKGGRSRSELPAEAPRSIAVASGKGGVGKTSLTLNLALALAQLDQRVLVVDGDFGLGKLDLLMGAQPRLNLGHVLDGECEVEEAVFTGPRGVRFLPGACGLDAHAVLDRSRRERFHRALARSSADTDLVLLDLATGIGPNSMDLARRASEVLLLTTPEPTAYADAYALIKILGTGREAESPRVVVNRARNDLEAQNTFLRLRRTSQRYLGVTPLFWGAVPEDPSVEDAVRRQKPFTLISPDAPASRKVRELAWRLLRGEAPEGGSRARIRSKSDQPASGLPMDVPAGRRPGRRPARWEAA